MREKERKKWRDELFNEIKLVAMPKHEWKQKEAPQISTTEPAAASQAAAPGDPTTANSVPGGPTAHSGG
jgi:hypothetical protein